MHAEIRVRRVRPRKGDGDGEIGDGEEKSSHILCPLSLNPYRVRRLVYDIYIYTGFAHAQTDNRAQRA